MFFSSCGYLFEVIGLESQTLEVLNNLNGENKFPVLSIVQNGSYFMQHRHFQAFIKNVL